MKTAAVAILLVALLGAASAQTAKPDAKAVPKYPVFATPNDAIASTISNATSKAPCLTVFQQALALTAASEDFDNITTKRTVFAPSDAAFAKLNLSEATLETLMMEHGADILAAHIVPGAGLDSDRIAAAASKDVETGANYTAADGSILTAFAAPTAAPATGNTRKLLQVEVSPSPSPGPLSTIASALGLSPSPSPAMGGVSATPAVDAMPAMDAMPAVEASPAVDAAMPAADAAAMPAADAMPAVEASPAVDAAMPAADAAAMPAADAMPAVEASPAVDAAMPAADAAAMPAAGAAAMPAADAMPAVEASPAPLDAAAGATVLPGVSPEVLDTGADALPGVSPEVGVSPDMGVGMPVEASPEPKAACPEGTPSGITVGTANSTAEVVYPNLASGGTIIHVIDTVLLPAEIQAKVAEMAMNASASAAGADGMNATDATSSTAAAAAAGASPAPRSSAAGVAVSVAAALAPAVLLAML